MKRWPLVIVMTLLMLGMVIPGCGVSHRYDSRLARADSLMNDVPDSALAIVKGVALDSLTDESDRAYLGLLLTQARYKCYITATSDTDINRALDYYRNQKSEHEKLTRAYLYKGTVMEDLGHPDSAMLYYKTAEATADEKDYVNLGQINTRIASLYRLYHADIQVCFEKSKNALNYYKKADDKRHQMSSLFHMGMCEGITSEEHLSGYLYQALDIAKEINDTYYIYQCSELLCRQLSMKDTSRHKAKRIALKCLEDYPELVEVDLLLDLAKIYALEGCNDSARFFINRVQERTSDHSAQVNVRKCNILSIIAKNENDVNKKNYYSDIANQLSDSIANNKQKYRIQQIENFNNLKSSNAKNRKISNLKLLIAILSSVFIIIMIMAMVYHFRRTAYAKSIIRELEGTHLDRHEELLKQIDAKDSIIQNFVKNLVFFMQTSIDASEKDSPKVIRQRIKDTIGNVVTKEFWTELRAYLDKNDNIISNIALNPKITESDLHFIELSCCGFSYIEIAITMGYSPNYISTKRKEIAKKLGINIPLQDYISQLLQDHSQQGR